MSMMRRMRFTIRGLALVCLGLPGMVFWGSSRTFSAPGGMELEVAEGGMEAVLYASKDWVQHPVAAMVDEAGRLMVVENQTEGRPEGWSGPEFDQVVRLLDEDGDERADRREVFFAGSQLTSDIAQGPEGWVYLVTRNEILRVRDADGDGKAEQVERRLVWVETKEGVPTGGVSGLAFDRRGGLVFGMSENGGVAYEIRGVDGMMYEEEADGGQIWRVKVDGSGLRRVAAGFSDPAGLCVDGTGEVFVTEAGLGGDWPSRLLHVGEGWDFGMQDRYSRIPSHPFLSWDGTRLGSMPMVCPVGEEPQDIIWYRAAPSDAHRGLPVDPNGRLLVAAWGDHQVEMYEAARGSRSATFGAKRGVLCRGGTGFWPTGLAARKDGAIYVLDWAGKGKAPDGTGAVWLIRRREPMALPEVPKLVGIADPAVALCDTILEGPAPSEGLMLEWLATKEAAIYRAAIRRLSRDGVLAKKLAAVGYQTDPRVRVGLLLAARLGTEREGVDMNYLPMEVDEMLRASLLDSDPEVSLPALHWVADHRIKRHRFLVRGIAEDPKLPVEVFLAALTALHRIDRPEEVVFSEEQLRVMLLKLVGDEAVEVGVKQLALRADPGLRDEISVGAVLELVKKAEDKGRVWLTHYLGQMSGEEKEAVLRGLVFDGGESAAVRSAALTHLTVREDDVPALMKMAASEDGLLEGGALAAMQGLRLTFDQQKSLKALPGGERSMMAQRVLGEVFLPLQRPAVANVTAWERYLGRVEGEPDLEQGRQVFLSPARGGCAVCHHAEGLGNLNGLPVVVPSDEATMEPILASLLQPNARVGVRGAGWTVATSGGGSHLVFRLADAGKARRYMDMKRQAYEWTLDEVAKREPVAVSVMPGNLMTTMTDGEIRNLVAYLEALRTE
jgi:putative membrane-bound dehydrogenase-like protein